MIFELSVIKSLLLVVSRFLIVRQSLKRNHYCYITATAIALSTGTTTTSTTFLLRTFLLIVSSLLFEKSKGALKEQLSAIKPILEDLRLKKEDRFKEFSEIQAQIVWITTEIAGNIPSFTSDDTGINERDLTVKKLGELKSHLEELQKEKVLFDLDFKSNVGE